MRQWDAVNQESWAVVLTVEQAEGEKAGLHQAIPFLEQTYQSHSHPRRYWNHHLVACTLEI